MRLACGHVFHRQCCIQLCNMEHPACPMCRGDLDAVASWKYVTPDSIAAQAEEPSPSGIITPTLNRIVPTQSSPSLVPVPSGDDRMNTPRSEESVPSSWQRATRFAPSFPAFGVSDVDYPAWSGSSGAQIGDSDTMTSEQLQVFHASTRLGGEHEGILIDPGSVGNLAGDAWVQSIAKQALKVKKPFSQKVMSTPVNVSGVGNGFKQAKHECVLPIACQSREGEFKGGTFTTPTVQDSNLPGLIGLSALEKMRTVLDLTTGTIHFLGPGDHTIDAALPPGTSSFKLSKAPSGHLLLPCTYYQDIDAQAQKVDKDEMSLLTDQKTQ